MFRILRRLSAMYQEQHADVTQVDDFVRWCHEQYGYVYDTEHK